MPDVKISFGAGRCLALGPFGDVVGAKPLQLFRRGLAAESRVAVREPVSEGFNVWITPLLVVHGRKNKNRHTSFIASSARMSQKKTTQYVPTLSRTPLLP